MHFQPMAAIYISRWSLWTFSAFCAS